MFEKIIGSPFFLALNQEKKTWCKKNKVFFAPPKYDTKLYHIYRLTNDPDKCFLIKGCCQDGNAYILENIITIFKDDLKMDVRIETLIWIHGDGPSPHFILYKEDGLNIKCDELERFIKSLLSKKSNKDKKLSSCMLSDVVLTDVKGLVEIKSKKLKKLLL